MNNFFRKIRQQLLSQNKMSKYLLYAIGEIVLVVIGILIALGLNSWNKTRENNIREKEILLSVQAEFKQNLIKLKDYVKNIDFSNNHRSKILTYLEEFGPDYVPSALDSLEYHLNGSYEERSLDLGQGSISTIINSNELSLIRSDSLRALLTSWQVENDDHAEEDRLYLDIVYHKYIPLLTKYYPMKYLHGSHTPMDSVYLLNEKFSGFVSKSPSKYKPNIKELIKDSDFENLLIWMDIKYNDRIIESKRLELTICSIIRLIEQELR
jgi:hypothetical protein